MTAKFKPENYKIALFDLDETLIRSDHIWDSVGDIWVKRHNLPTVTPQELVDHGWSESVGFTDGSKIVMDVLGLKPPEYTPESIGAEWISIAKECYTDPKEVPIIPGAREFLKMLNESGVKMGVVTSNCVALTEKVLAAHGIKDFFSVIVTSDMAARPKPFPDPYIMAAHKMGVEEADFSRVIVFEDSMQNGKSVLEVGMKLCSVLADGSAAAKRWPEYSKMGDYAVKESYNEINQTLK